MSDLTEYGKRREELKEMWLNRRNQPMTEELLEEYCKHITQELANMRLANDEEFLQLAINRIDNPLKAIGIVMRDTGTHIDSTTEIRFYDKRGQQCLRIDTCDIYGTTSGEGILNTLKEGK